MRDKQRIRLGIIWLALIFVCSYVIQAKDFREEKTEFKVITY